MFALRAAERKDSHYLMDIDIKCFEFPWLPSDWRCLADNSFATVATYNDTPIGMAIFSKTIYGDIEILKIGVKEQFRHQGVGRALLFNCLRYGREINALRLIVAVPESRCRPGEDDVSQWLLSLGFRAQVPLLRDYYTFYGQSEDGIIFTLAIPQT